MILGITGHRPQSLGGYSPTVTTRLHRLARCALSSWQPDTVITGMAQGWDQAVAHAAHSLGIPFRAYIPGTWQPDAWPPAGQEHYHRLLDLAAEVRVCTKAVRYEAAAMHLRNMDIVNDSDMMLALWDGQRRGGTWNCIEYATERSAVPTRVVNLWPLWVAPCDA